MGYHSRFPSLSTPRRLPLVAWAIAALALIALLLALPGPSWSASSGAVEAAAARKGLGRYSVEYPAISNRGSGRAVALALGGARVTLELQPASVRSPRFRLLVEQESGALWEVAPLAPITYRGVVAGRPGSAVAASLTEGRLTAIVLLPDSPPYCVEPVGNDGVASAGHFVYRGDDVTSQAGVCKVDEPAQPLPPEGPVPRVPAQSLKVAEIAFDSDYEFFVKNQSSVNGTVQDIENILNGVNVVYQRDVEITHSIVTIIVRSVPGGPYTSTAHDTLYSQFRTEWNSHHTSVVRDMAHLMTGKNINGGVIGYAAVGAVCNRSSAYGLSESRYSQSASYNARLSLTAHELGHNWNAVHCNAADPCHIMCSSLGACDGLGMPEFEPTGQQAITAFKATRSCLGTVQLAVESPVAVPALRLEAARPTPFGEHTRLRFYLERSGKARLAIYDVSGRIVALLVDGVVPAGWHEATWKGRTMAGRRPEAGVFLARLETGGEVTTQRVVFVP